MRETAGTSVMKREKQKKVNIWINIIEYYFSPTFYKIYITVQRKGYNTIWEVSSVCRRNIQSNYNKMSGG